MKLVGNLSMKEVLFVLFVFFVCHVEISVTMMPLTQALGSVGKPLMSRF
jgi:hypothetical protein